MDTGKPVPLLGRLAVQLKLIDLNQLNTATQVQSRSEADEKMLGEVLVELGFISSTQLEKLESVQRNVIANHRAKQAESARVAAQTRQATTDGPPQPAPQARRPTTSAPPAAPASAPNVAPPAAAPAAPAPSEAPPTRPVAAQAVDLRREVESGEPVHLVAAPGDECAGSLGLSAIAPSSVDRQRLQRLLSLAAQAGSSDIHIHSGAPPRIRVNGVLTETDAEVLSPEDTERMVMAVLSEKECAELLRFGEFDACLELPAAGRFRANVYRQQRGFDAVLRSIPKEPPTLDQLGLPSWIAKHTNYHQGMVLITGPAGCGKSATMAAMVNLINEERQEHILTIEDPIEVIHPSKRCLVNQRHAGRHTGSFARALRAALREDPDVIVIGELRDLETISLAMTAAETGHFVLATLHTNNAVRTINRMIGAFPSNQQAQVRTMLSESLRAVISQRLVPTADETGRAAALELLVINKAIGNMIRDEKTVQIRSSIQTGSAHGMMLLEQSLNELVKAGTITREAALELAEEEKLITA